MSKKLKKVILKPVVGLPSLFGADVADCGLDDPLGLLEKGDKLKVYKTREIKGVWGMYYGADLYYVYKVDDIYFFKCKSEFGSYFAVFKGKQKNCIEAVRNMDKIVLTLQ